MWLHMNSIFIKSCIIFLGGIGVTMIDISFEQVKWTSKNQLAFYKYVRDE